MMLAGLLGRSETMAMAMAMAMLNDGLYCFPNFGFRPSY
jgi:hypothetical protein